MLTITVEAEEFWSDELQEFYTLPAKTFHFEHSLASISKWEMKWHIPYLGEERQGYKKTEEQSLDYIRCMCFEEIDDIYLVMVASKYYGKLKEYMEDPMTATWISNKNKMPSCNLNNITTSEQVYYMMAANSIPFECENWHFNRLLALIRVCNEENGEHKPMSKREILEHNKYLNAMRRKK